MRVEISYKFIMGFIIVVGSIVLLDAAVPSLGIPQEWQMLFTMACALLVGLVLGWFFSKKFTANIRLLRKSAENLGEGDISQEIQLRRTLFPDETEDLGASLNLVIRNLQELVGTIRSSSMRVADSAQSLSATSQEMTASGHEVAYAIEHISHGAETQAEMVERSSRLIREMAVSIDLIAASSKKVASSARESAGTAEKGGETVKLTMEQMKKVLEMVKDNGQQIVSFGDQVQKIGKIVEVITGIAQKTNLLSLNATIEAARAGEYGRGFAVVADEISKLAESTGKSAGEITSLIGAIQEESRHIQNSMQKSILELDAGRTAIDTTGSAFEEIIQTALTTQTKAGSIAELAEKQTDGAKSMVGAIEEISRVVTDNAAATQEVSASTQQQSASLEEMAHAARDLSVLADQLLDSVRRFKLGGEVNE